MATRRRILHLLGGLGFGVAGLGAFLLLLELMLRLFPALLPAGGYGFGVFSQELGMGVHGGTVLYNKVRPIEREANHDGFLDIDHDREKKPGILRIGFFGDSYVEAEQVERGQMFYRVLGDRLATLQVETLGFGISGWGTLHAYLAERVYGPLYDLDAVVYVFVENDLGDNLYKINVGQQTSQLMPFGELSEAEPGFSLRWVRDPHEKDKIRSLLKLIQRHSRLAQVVYSRISLLRARGVQVHADTAAVEMMERAGWVPDPSSAPDTWPPEIRQEAEELGRRVLARWRADLRARNVPFFVLYVPRGEGQLTGETPLESTWRPWLGRVTAELGIPLIDPSAALAARLAAGEPMFPDHFSPAGHEVVARVLEAELAPVAAARRQDSTPRPGS